MEAATATAIGAAVGFIGTVTGGFIANFIGEDYKRFREAQALAGGLAGELASHAEGAKQLGPMLDKLLDMLHDGEPLTFGGTDRPQSRFYEANVGKVGLLGAPGAEKVVHTYDTINAFRNTMANLYEGQDLPVARQKALVHTAKWALGLAMRETDLPARLRAFASSKYRPFYRWEA